MVIQMVEKDSKKKKTFQQQPKTPTAARQRTDRTRELTGNRAVVACKPKKVETNSNTSLSHAHKTSE
jgi:hypothetical protein